MATTTMTEAPVINGVAAAHPTFDSIPDVIEAFGAPTSPRLHATPSASAPGYAHSQRIG